MLMSETGLLFLTDLEQITDCNHFLLPRLQEAEASILREFEHGMSTVPLRALKSIKLQKAVVAVGMFSLLESSIQAEMGWKRPFSKLEKLLGEKQELALCDLFNAYRLAINVLKHGQGVSLKSLLSRNDLPFRVRGGLDDEETFVDLDNLLVDVDDDFISGCAEVVERIAIFTREYADV